MKYGLLILMTSVLSVATFGQTEECSVTSFYWDKVTKFNSSRTLVTAFTWNGDESEMTQRLDDKNSGIGIVLGAERIFGIQKNEPKRIRVAIAFTGSADEIFSEETRSEAETSFDEKWKWLSVSKLVAKNDRIYTFTFGCERKQSKQR